MSFFRSILEKRIARLERKIGDLSRGTRFSAWGEDDTELIVRHRDGVGQLAQAIVIGRLALNSGDDQQIREAAVVCENLEEFAQGRARRRGGVTRGEDQVKRSERRRHNKYTARFGDLVASGTDPLIARRMICDQIVKDGKIKLPSEPTLRKWFPTKGL